MRSQLLRSTKLILAAKVLIRHLFRLLPFPCSLFAVKHINRKLCHQLPPGHTLIFSGYYQSLSVRVDTTYPIERQMLSGIYDSSTVRLLERFVHPGDICIDAGANVGALTLVMACLVGNEGRVFAFEPGPELFVKLQTNLALNSDIADRAVLYQCGLSDEVATLRWQECASNRGNAFLSKSEGKVVVPVNLLDEIPELNEAKVRFIKIDVEGMELRVLRGATRIIERTRCLVYFEAMPGARRRKSAEDHEDIFVGLQGFFEELGYDIVGVSQSGRLERVRELNFFQNNLAFPTERKFVLETRRGRDDLPSSVLEPTAETG